MGADFQFHLEVDAAMIERWLRMPAYRDELAQSGLGRDERSIREASAALLGRMSPLAHETFDRFLDLVGRPDKRTARASQHALGG